MSLAKKSIFLVVSPKMDSNKKPDRNEQVLVRMSKKARTNLDFKDETVELWPNTNSPNNRINRGKLLTIFQAFKEDIAMLKKMLADGEITADQFDRTGFVTTNTFKFLTSGNIIKNNTDDIWISKGVHDLTIGADPEFLLFRADGTVQPANSINILTKNSVVGCDGAMAELRPAPAITPSVLVENIRDILTGKIGNIKSIDDYKWLGGCFYKDDHRNYSLGGHIHIGNPKKLLKRSGDERTAFFKVLNKIIDELLSIIMVRLDGDGGKQRRTAGTYQNYGYYGGLRVCDGRLEHRTLSGEWLIHPVLAEAVFGVVKAIVEETYKHVSDHDFDSNYMCPREFRSIDMYSKDFNSWSKIPIAKDMQCTASSTYMVDFLSNSNSAAVNRALLARWKTKMKSFSTYNSYSKHIETLLNILSIPLKDLAKVDKDLKANWVEGKKFLV